MDTDRRHREGDRERDYDRRREGSSSHHRHRSRRADDEGDRCDSRDRTSSSRRGRDGDGDRDGDRNRERHRDSARDRDRRGHRERDRDDDHHRKHKSSRRRGSHDSDDDEEEERRRRKKEKRSTRNRDETSQERRQRKAAKRAAAHADADADAEELAAAQRANAAEMLLYSAEDNPFNDANLGQSFKWAKKEQKERKMGLTPAEAKARDEQRRQEAQEEIARLNAQRAQREQEQALREEEEAKMARLAESAAMSEWVAKEDDFHLEQSRRRAAIRIRENRAKPIDILAMNLRWADPHRSALEKDARKRTDEDQEDDEAGLEIDLEEPYEIFDALSLEETEELHQDIQMYLTLEKNQQNLDFWRSMVIVCDDKLAELRRREQQQQQQQGGVASVIDPSVKAEMDDMLQHKSYDDLVALQDRVAAKLASGEPIDVEYWEALLCAILVWRAKAKLRDLHEVVLENRLEYLRKKQRDEAARQHEDLVAQMGYSDGQEGMMALAPAAGETAAAAAAAAAAHTPADDDAEYDPAEMDPPALDTARLSYDERHMPVHTWSDLRASLVAARRRILGAAFVPRASASARGEAGTSSGGTGTGTADDVLFAQEAAKGIDVSEEAFTGEAPEAVRSTAGAGADYTWADKYRPRKPRYFNRVHTGFEWNKYNQTHYDSDNPPPKVVQGYKFNIFYPDLIDKSKAPSYRIVRERDNDETVVLVFEAGAPYEDLAFRIVNRPWQYSHKRGFRSSFDRGVLQLHFHFQRTFYRK